MRAITKDTNVAEVLARCPGARRVFDQYGLKGCGAGRGPVESIEFFAAVHQADLAVLLRELNRELQSPSDGTPAYSERLPDAIYRRFFKAGIIVVLSLGCFWGAINLFQIGRSGSFLQMGLLPAIYAHANAMVYGFVLMFVMGFAYQSVPRFKNTTLWRPELANLSMFLLAGGIALRAFAELSGTTVVRLLAGAISGGAQIAAVLLFVLVLRATAAQASGPRSPYEKFLAAAFLWLLVGTLLNEVFFLARLAVTSQQELIRRIALIDGPLRDIQLLGFAAFVIAGISQRLVPTMYGLKPPAKDRHRLLFVLMNATLLLNIGSYLLVYSTHRPVFVIGLQLAYLLMPVWAVLLARQVGVFSAPARPDRTFKFVRAAYVWLIISAAMMPLFLIYGRLTHQVFAHSYMGAHRHAFTVGFITLMIVGISSKVTPILSGVDSKSLTALWGPFLLLNTGNAARVTLQILTDFIPGVAYPLVGLTGFIEVAGLAWWGAHLWRIMSRSEAAAPAQIVTIAPLPAA